MDGKAWCLGIESGALLLLCSGLPDASSEGDTRPPVQSPCFSPPAGCRLELVGRTDREEKSPTRFLEQSLRQLAQLKTYL
jgi:hypothetical protein